MKGLQSRTYSPATGPFIFLILKDFSTVGKRQLPFLLAFFSFHIQLYTHKWTSSKELQQ